MKSNALRLLAPPLVLILLYWATALSYLAVLPGVYQDEPWQASTGLKLAREGIFGSDLFAGLWRMEERYYGFLPVYPVALALVYRVTDVGLFQSRWLGIVCGALTLALTFSLARRIWHDPRIGALAVFLMLSVRWFGETSLHPTGILFFDATRLARYDVLVPVLALLSVHALLSAQSGTARAWYLGVGCLVGLAGLTHLYGLFLLPIFILVILWQRQHRWLFDVTLLLLGILFVWLPYFAYVLADLPAWQMQTRLYAPRFEVFDPQWYLENLQTEAARYALGPGRMRSFLLRPGVWLSFLVLLFSWLALAARVRANARARVVLLAVVLLPLAYALLLQNKFINYLLLIIPFAALVTAWGVLNAWTNAAQSRNLLLRAGIAIALGLVLIEAATRVVSFQTKAAVTTPYAVLNARLRASIPPGARVLGLQDYWFGWDAYDYHSLAVPLMLVLPGPVAAPPTMNDAMNAQRPEYLVLDDATRLYLSDHTNPMARDLRSWIQQHRAARVADFSDASYGRFEIYRVEPAE